MQQRYTINFENIGRICYICKTKAPCCGPFMLFLQTTKQASMPMTQPKRPLFSIITVTYNAADTIEPTMRSVASQTCTSYEHIIMDGVSKDDTLKIAQDLSTGRTRIFSSKDRGLYDAMNKAIGEARGEYLIFLNAGDSFHASGTLDILARAAFDHDFPGVIYGQTELVDAQRNYVGERHLTAPEKLTLDSFKQGMLVCHQAFTVLRRIAPLYDLRWRFSADYEWCIRCLQHSRQNIYVGCTTIDYLSEGMTTRNRRASLKERFKIMAHYYGLLPTLFRHAGFFARDLKRKLKK